VIDALEPELPFSFSKVHHEANGHFPNGVPNPLLEGNREATASVVRAKSADLGIAWDGDFDRCFFFTSQGDFVEGYYIVGLLAEAFLAQHGPQRVVHDPRLTWNTQAIVAAAGGEAVASKTGHAFIKERMREVDAIYGGEMSAHHYFRDFAYCDSGMIPWLLVAGLMSEKKQPLVELVAAREAEFPCSGEINRRVEDPASLLANVEAHYAPTALRVEHRDGLSIENSDWRFNLRMSNTEPVVRLNVESRGNSALMEARTEELLRFMEP
jgi:phosphomannomutase